MTDDRGEARAGRESPSSGFKRKLAARAAVLAVVAFGFGLLGSPQVRRPVDRYQAGEFTSRAIRAPFDLSVIDEEATARQRTAAAARVPVVASLDARVPESLASRFESAWTPVAEALAAHPAPEVPERPTRAARQEARDAAAARRTALDEAYARVERQLGTAVVPEVRAFVEASGGPRTLTDSLRRMAAAVYAAPVSVGAAILTRSALNGDPEAAVPGVLVDAESAREISVPDLGRLRELPAARAELPSLAGAALPDAPAPVRAWVVSLLGGWLRPNVQPDAAATERRRVAAAAAVLPVSLNFQRNQLIIGEGEPVTRQTLLVLDALREARLDRNGWSRLLGRSGAMLALLLLGFGITGRGVRRVAIDPDAFAYGVTSLVGTAVMFRLWLEMIASLTVPFPFVPEAALVLLFPAAATTIYARAVLPFQAGTTYVVVQSGVLGLLWQADLLFFVYLLISGYVAAQLAASCRRRQCLVRAGLVAGVTVGPVAVCLALLGGETALDRLAWAAAGAIAGCALSGLAVLALSPMFEWAFGHMTHVRLMELMNYEQPLLRKLTELSPGTFQHSVTVSLLTDAAARAIEADALLSRVGALYHDVGKTVRPEYFIENQSHGVNPHDALPPEESARILIAHVEDGARMVREARVGPRVADFVLEHHGTSLIRYFYAKAEAAGGTIDPANFRYPGPRPRSRETAILMIADQIEATARAMDEPGEVPFRRMVDETIARVVGEGQLDQAPLTFRELRAIRDAFVQILVNVHHRRIKYPGQRTGESRQATPA